MRALRYYLDRTKDLRGSRSLLFISFKKGHTSDIRPATLSSWLKQTILLCYKQADQQALDLVQVKAHDIRAFTASKAFYGGVSVDQIMQACHWKAHNTFTNFYLKDLTWSCVLHCTLVLKQYSLLMNLRKVLLTGLSLSSVTK